MIYINKEEFCKIWSSGIIVFDTSSLLRIYEWNYESAIELKDILDYKIDSIWIPYHVNKEFKNQKNSVMHNNKYSSIFSHLEKETIKWNKINNILKRWEKRGYEVEFINKLKEIETQGLNNKNKQELVNITDEIQKNHFSKLSVENLLDILFSNIGEPLTESQEKNLRDKYDIDNTSPGAEDNKKKNGNKYGDFFIWNEIKNKALNEKKDIIFITSDVKKDWFEDTENLIPRSELITEFNNDTSQNIIITSLTEFLSVCSIYLNNDIEKLIALSIIQEQVIEKYYTWYPDDLVDRINEYTAEDDSIKMEMSDLIDSDFDTVSFDEVVEVSFDINDSYYEIFDDYVTINSELYVTANFNADFYCSGENGCFGTVSIDLKVLIAITVAIEWQSNDSERKALNNIAEDIEILDIEVIEGEKEDYEPDYEDQEPDYEDYELDYEDQEPDYEDYEPDYEDQEPDYE